jgi:putative ABC transport system permease protein
MWRNYLTVGYRALTKNRTYAFINIAGLAIGLAACLLILLYVRYETSYDSWLPDAERVYQVQSIYTDPETGEVSRQQGTHGVIAAPMAKDFPQIEAITRADSVSPVFMRGGEATFAPMIIADEGFFKILQGAVPPRRSGDGAQGHGQPRPQPLRGAPPLRRHQCGRPDGDCDPPRRAVRAARHRRVRGHPAQQPFEPHDGREDERPGRGGMRLGLRQRHRLPEAQARGGSGGDSPPDAVLGEAQHPAVRRRRRQGQRGRRIRLALTRVTDVHLSGAEGEPERPGNDRRTIVTFSIVALLILAMATVNFVNLATARASQRAREVALRKVLGANRRQLIVQFLGESILLTGVALLLALALVELLLPSLSAFLDADLSISYFGAGGVLLPAIGLLLLVGLAAGLYPAFYLSRYQPAAVLRANKSAAEPAGSGRLRGALVVGQFAISIGLIICTAVVYAQTSFARTTDPGYKRQGIIQIGNMGRAAVVDQTDTVIREIARVDGVKSVAGTNITVASGTTLNTRVMVPGREKPVTIGWYSAHPDFFDTMGIKLLAGRTLSRSFANDSAKVPYEPEEATIAAARAMVQRGVNVVVNELAAKQMGFATPAAAIGRQIKADQFGEDAGLLPLTIVGVVENSRFRSIREPVEPMIFPDGGYYRSLVLRYDSANPEALMRRVEAVWKRLAPEVPFEGEFADDQLAELYLTDKARAQAFAGFALLAVVIACLGLFGLAAFTAERRTKEIGIRKVFGARVRDIVQLLAWQFSKPVIVANLIAWPAAWWVMRDWLNSFDARIDLGPGPFLLAGILALVIALGTIAGHAMKIARLNPIHALRYE